MPRKALAATRAALRSAARATGEASTPSSLAKENLRPAKPQDEPSTRAAIAYVRTSGTSCALSNNVHNKAPGVCEHYWSSRFVTNQHWTRPARLAVNSTHVRIAVRMRQAAARSGPKRPAKKRIGPMEIGMNAEHSSRKAVIAALTGATDSAALHAELGAPMFATAGAADAGNTWAPRDHAAQPARTLGPKARVLMSRRRQRSDASPSLDVAHDDALRLTTVDAGLSFTLKPAEGALYLERIQCRPIGTHIVQCMVFANAQIFLRWCDAEPLRFDDPGLHHRLRHQGLECFGGGP